MPSPALLCRAALQQATAKWPYRDKKSDGIMSSQEHKKQNPYSDHDWGNAFDLTHDPAHGCDAHGWAAWLVKQNFPEVKYVISNSKIWSKKRQDEGWREYKGSNPHVKHVHVSINERYRNTVRTWFPATFIRPPTQPPVKKPATPVGDIVAALPLLKIGKNDAADVLTLQALLNARYGNVVVNEDGDFGIKTERVVKAFQKLVGLDTDGIVGQNTWRKLLRV